MYESIASLDLHRLSRQNLQKHYESDEEDASESDGGPDLVPSLVGSQRADTLDSDLSADENSHMDLDSDGEEQEEPLFSSYSSKRPRPVSMDTIKRRSDVTFQDNTHVFDPEKEMILELPSPESSPGLSSSLFLPRSVYTPSATHSSTQRARSASPSSIFSMESAEIQVAQQITLLQPPTRPTLVFINALGSRSKSSKPRPTNARSRGNARNRESRVFDGRLETGFDFPRVIDMKPPTPPASVSSGTDRKSSTTSAPDMLTVPEEGGPINAQTAPYRPASPRARPQSIYQPRPRTADLDQPLPSQLVQTRARHITETVRPSAVRTNSNTSVLSHSHSPAPSLSGSPYIDTLRQGYMPECYSEAGISRTASPVSIASSPPSSTYTLSSTRDWQPGHSSHSLPPRPQVLRRSGRKHSAASSVHSLASVRSEINLQAPAPGTTFYSQKMSQSSYDSDFGRKPSQLRHGRHNSSATIARGFMGLRFGKKGSNKA
ncbi:hypothetical protein N7468_007919 [Penicillium chermesinum]|uniref:Uncharacterized protein n=1 Tax=Penicillium chermesinum TaxID=63820 RepID=A0A9W9NNU0_9EURO|nr:uncharacterized protein N7468_007919 [Penicillium chermesinum]KAJ5223377.1 hypothetical protein N7468_007919 [Penicillium chermesinum]KAJ6155784.1 hypothetical protein N7470_006350 [Penicillium chermesinum]